MSPKKFTTEVGQLFFKKVGFKLYDVPRYFLSRIHVLLRIPTLYFVLRTWYLAPGTPLTFATTFGS